MSKRNSQFLAIVKWMHLHDMVSTEGRLTKIIFSFHIGEETNT